MRCQLVQHIVPPASLPGSTQAHALFASRNHNPFVFVFVFFGASTRPGALPSAAPTSAPSAEAGNASAAPTASPSTGAASSAAPTVAPTLRATAAEEEFGFLGPGFVSGSFSADGVSDDVLSSLGEEGVVRQVCVCVCMSLP